MECWSVAVIQPFFKSTSASGLVFNRPELTRVRELVEIDQPGLQCQNAKQKFRISVYGANAVRLNYDGRCSQSSFS